MSLKRMAYSFVLAVLITLLSVSDIMLAFANVVNDAVYQRHVTPNENITIIGIDDKALDKFGSMPWDRAIMAQLITELNEDESTRPAVIGIDIIYDTEGDKDSDAALAEAAAIAPNVVLGMYASFDSEIVSMPSGDFFIDDNVTPIVIEPFDALKEVTLQGHVNAMLDNDGVLRHGIWQIDVAGGEKIPSFCSVIADLYTQNMQLDAPVAPITDAKHMWYIVQQSGPGGYSDGISVADVIDGNVDLEFFKDKIVLIGPYSSVLKDEYKTAIDYSQNMHGVEYQANAIGAVLAQEIKYEQETLHTVLLFIISFALFFFMQNRKFLSATFIFLGVCVAWMIFCVVAFNFGAIITVVYVPIVSVLAYIMSIGINYYKEAMQREKTVHMLNRYVSPTVVKQLLKDESGNVELGGELVDIAVLFVDVRGFTQLASRISAPEVVEILNSIFRLTSTCIFNSGGTLDKYIGDSTMAFWNAPLRQEDYVHKAVVSAIEMVKGLETLQQEIKGKYGQDVSCGIGINCGTAVVGNVGTYTRMDYTAIGDTVNLAARLEGIAAGGEILISKSVAAKIEGRIKYSSVGTDIKVKGISDGIEIFRIETDS